MHNGRNAEQQSLCVVCVHCPYMKCFHFTDNVLANCTKKSALLLWLSRCLEIKCMAVSACHK